MGFRGVLGGGGRISWGMRGGSYCEGGGRLGLRDQKSRGWRRVVFKGIAQVIIGLARRIKIP